MSRTYKGPPIYVDEGIRHIVEKYRNNPDLLKKEMDRAHVCMKESLEKSRKLLRELRDKYRQLGDLIYTDENEIKWRSIEILQEQVEQEKSKIMIREKKIKNVTILTSSKDLEYQLSIFSEDFSKAVVQAVVKFDSLEDAYETLKEVRQDEADKKEYERKLELIKTLQKSIVLDLDVGDSGVDVDEAHLHNERERIKQLITLEEKKINDLMMMIMRNDVEKMTLSIPNISKEGFLIP